MINTNQDLSPQDFIYRPHLSRRCSVSFFSADGHCSLARKPARDHSQEPSLGFQEHQWSRVMTCRVGFVFRAFTDNTPAPRLNEKLSFANQSVQILHIHNNKNTSVSCFALILKKILIISRALSNNIRVSALEL